MKERKELALHPSLIQLADRVTFSLLGSALVGAGYWFYQKWFFNQNRSTTLDSQPMWLGI